MMDILLSVINEDILKTIKTNELNTVVPSDIIAKFYLGGVFNVGIEALRTNNLYSKEELIKYLENLIPDYTYKN